MLIIDKLAADVQADLSTDNFWLLYMLMFHLISFQIWKDSSIWLESFCIKMGVMLQPNRRCPQNEFLYIVQWDVVQSCSSWQVYSTL